MIHKKLVQDILSEKEHPTGQYNAHTVAEYMKKMCMDHLYLYNVHKCTNSWKDNYQIVHYA